MKYPSLLVALCLAQSAFASPVAQSIRPQAREIAVDASANTASVAVLSETTEAATNAGFQRWIAEFKIRAQTAGIRSSVLDDAFEGVRLDPKIIKRDRNQSEFTKTIWDYLDTAVSATRIKNGRSALANNKSVLTQIEAKYGVEKEVVVAIWGLESAYGNFRGGDSIIQSLGTLAYDGRRAAFFEEQLMAALRILQNGDTSPQNMTGSWAGAMGHTQFMPTSYLSYAVDFTGDGKRDIWSKDPSDALASTAAYLKHFGWISGQPWGVEVRLPDGFDYTSADRKIEKLPSEWARVGVVDRSGKPVRDYGMASVLLPAGARGAAFLVFKNFEVIERYNTADAYVIGVGHLSDRIKGGPAIQAEWPREDRALSFDERTEMQRRLTAAGFDTQGVDGKIGPLTIDAVRAFQLSKDMVPDGYASLRLLNALR